MQQEHLEVLLEDIRDKIEMMAEGYDLLNRKIDRVEANLSEKIADNSRKISAAIEQVTANSEKITANSLKIDHLKQTWPTRVRNSMKKLTGLRPTWKPIVTILNVIVDTGWRKHRRRWIGIRTV